MKYKNALKMKNFIRFFFLFICLFDFFVGIYILLILILSLEEDFNLTTYS